MVLHTTTIVHIVLKARKLVEMSFRQIKTNLSEVLFESFPSLVDITPLFSYFQDFPLNGSTDNMIPPYDGLCGLYDKLAVKGSGDIPTVSADVPE